MLMSATERYQLQCSWQISAGECSPHYTNPSQLAQMIGGPWQGSRRTDHGCAQIHSHQPSFEQYSVSCHPRTMVQPGAWPCTDCASPRPSSVLQPSSEGTFRGKATVQTFAYTCNFDRKEQQLQAGKAKQRRGWPLQALQVWLHRHKMIHAGAAFLATRTWDWATASPESLGLPESVACEGLPAESSLGDGLLEFAGKDGPLEIEESVLGRVLEPESESEPSQEPCMKEVGSWNGEASDLDEDSRKFA